MNININFSEITGFVEKNYKQKITLAAVDGKSLEISYKLLKFIPQVSVSVRIAVVSVCRDCIKLSYDGSTGVPLLIDAVVKIFQGAIPAGVEIDTINRTIKLYPQQVEQLQKALKYVSLDDVAFTDSAVEIRLLLA